MPRELIIDCGLEGVLDGGQFDVCLVPANAPDKTALLEGIVPGQSIEAPFDIEEIHFLAREGGYWGLSFSSPPRTISGVIPKLPSASLPRDRNRAKYAIEAINSSTKRVFLNVCDQGMVVLK